MACSSIHLAVSKLYLEKSKIKVNRYKVLKGTLYPDTVKNKDFSHYTDLNRGKDIVSHLQGKVNLYNFLLEDPILNDFELGWFIHLITDYLFFDECFSREYLLSHSYDEFRKDLYFSYDCINQYITSKYNITMEDYTIYPSEFYPGREYGECLFTKEMLDDFIERVSSINLELYKAKILKNRGNVKPF